MSLSVKQVVRAVDEALPVSKGAKKEVRALSKLTLDEAMKAQETYAKDNLYDKGPLFRWLALQELAETHKLYKSGQEEAIMEALYICTFNSLPVPLWLEMAFLNAYRKVRQYRAKSWDEVFGKPHRKGTHLATKRQEREKSLLVYYRIREIKESEPQTPIDGSLFERVGRELALGGKTLIEEYYYKWKNKLTKP